MAETRADAEQAFDALINAYNDKYPKAARCFTEIVTRAGPLPQRICYRSD